MIICMLLLLDVDECYAHKPCLNGATCVNILEVIAALVRLGILEKTAEKVLFSTCLNIYGV